jgi:hypothetical protein
MDRESKESLNVSFNNTCHTHEKETQLLSDIMRVSALLVEVEVLNEKAVEQETSFA